MNRIVVVAMDVMEYTKFLELALKHNIPHYELSRFFEIEGFTTLEEVENWWINDPHMEKEDK